MVLHITKAHRQAIPKTQEMGDGGLGSHTEGFIAQARRGSFEPESFFLSQAHFASHFLLIAIQIRSRRPIAFGTSSKAARLNNCEAGVEHSS